MVYLPTCIKLAFMVNVGEYLPYMNPLRFDKLLDQPFPHKKPTTSAPMTPSHPTGTEAVGL